MKKLIILIIAIFTISFANAQWQQTSLDSTTINCITTSGNNIYAGTNIGIYLSNSNGISWTACNNGITSNSDIKAIGINGNNIFAGSYGNGAFLSTNNCSNWTYLNLGLSTTNNYNSIFSFAFKNNKIYAATFNGVYLSTNNGSSWLPTSNQGFPNQSPLQVYILMIKDSIIFAKTIMNIFTSNDSIYNWMSASNGLPNVTSGVTSLVYLGNNVIAGTRGVFTTSNNGSSWTGIGLSNQVIFSLALSGNNIFAGTGDANGGGSMFLLSDNGVNWSEVNTGLPNTKVTSLAVNGTYIFAGTLNGVWRRPLSEMVGIKENNLNNNISIYPNPAKDNLTIETNSNTKQNLEIVNLLGQSIYTSYIYNKTTINVSAFAKGVYILKLNTDKGIMVKKFVKE